MAKAPAKKAGGNDDLVLELMEKVEALSERVTGAEAAIAALGSNVTDLDEGAKASRDALQKAIQALSEATEGTTRLLAGRIDKIELAQGNLQALLVGEHTGAPDVVARRVLTGFLKLLNEQRREMPTARQGLVKEIMTAGQSLLPRGPGA